MKIINKMCSKLQTNVRSMNRSKFEFMKLKRIVQRELDELTDQEEDIKSYLMFEKRRSRKLRSLGRCSRRKRKRKTETKKEEGEFESPDDADTESV